MQGNEIFINLEVTGLVWWGALIGCILLSFFCSGMEAGFLSLNPLRISQWSKANVPQARQLEKHLQEPEHFLRVALVVNTTSNFLVMALVISKVFTAIHADIWVIGLLLLPLVFLFYVTCELAPKLLFSRFPNRLCLRLIRVFSFIDYWISPVANLLFRISSLFLPRDSGPTVARSLVNSREELRELLKETAMGLTPEEKKLISNSLTLSVRTLEKITQPLSRCLVYFENDTVGIAKERAREKTSTRGPVLAGQDQGQITDNSRRVIGILNIKSILFDEKARDESQSILPWVESCIRLPSSMALEDALRIMQTKRVRMAIVTRPAEEGQNHPNGVQSDEAVEDWGLVSLQDILTVVFGNVHL